MGVSAPTIAKKENGDLAVKPPERRRFAEVFGLTLDQFDALWRAKEIPQTKDGQNRIPVINRAPAGRVVNYEEWGTDSGQGMEYIDRDQQTQADLLFAVIVVGDSMMPTLADGDYVIFHPLDRERPRRGEPRLDPGRVVFVRFAVDHDGGGCVLARYFPAPDGGLHLVKDNRQYPPTTIIRDKVVNIAVAVQVRSSRGL